MQREKDDFMSSRLAAISHFRTSIRESGSTLYVGAPFFIYLRNLQTLLCNHTAILYTV